MNKNIRGARALLLAGVLAVQTAACEPGDDEGTDGGDRDGSADGTGPDGGPRSDLGGSDLAGTEAATADGPATADAPAPTDGDGAGDAAQNPGGPTGDARLWPDSPLGPAHPSAPDAAWPSYFTFQPSNVTVAQLRLGNVSDLGDVVIDNPTCSPDEGDGDRIIRCTSGSTISPVAGLRSLRIRNGNEPPFDVFLARSWTIRPGIRFRAARVVLVALEQIEVQGQLSADGQGGRWSSIVPVPPQSGPGAGAPGDGGRRTGSGGASFCGSGGIGAYVTGGMRAPTYGPATLVPPTAGSAGGSNFGASGGDGGGFLQLVAGKRITVPAGGAITAGGTGGWPDGAGGGSGGGLLLEAPVVEIAGAVTANGGGGAGAGYGQDSHGQAARADATPAAGGIDTNRIATGGRGGAGDMIMGEDGKSISNIAGGGGGAGRIRINSAGTPAITGVISPSVASGCTSLGALGGAP